jgi:heme A synthase
MRNDWFDYYLKWAFPAALGISIFTGFGNMPLWGRYFVSDIPGLGWSADFFINIYVHYLSGGVLLALSTYYIIHYNQRRSRDARLSRAGVLRVVAFGMVLVSGALSALKNLPAINLPLAGLMAVVFFHLGAVMVYILISLACRILRKPWMS